MSARVMSTAGLVFKGTGFYITDYGKDGKKPQQTTAEPAKPAEATPAPSQAETKTAAEPKPAAETKPAAAAKKAE